MKLRINKLRNILRREKLDAILISNPQNIRYISGFSGTDSYCLLTLHDSFIVTDFRYDEQAREESPDSEVISQGDGLFKKAASVMKSSGAKKIGIESNHITVREKEVLEGLTGNKLLPAFMLIEGMRVIKDDGEIMLIRKAADVARRTCVKISKDIRHGISEKHLAAKIDFTMKSLGADQPSFETIVASGPNASMPHARPTGRNIGNNEAVVMDFGARIDGYNSDLTRTHIIGRINKHYNIIYSIVKDAQLQAISRIRPGIKIADIDKAARGYITKKGFGKYFGHATGHGIGLDIHELPSISSKAPSIIKENMVFSVEPGIYLPGEFGVRIEDTILVNSKGCEVLTR